MSRIIRALRGGVVSMSLNARRELDPSGERVAVEPFSQSLASRRQRLSQAMVRSTTQRPGLDDEALHREKADRLTISVDRDRAGCRPGRGERPAPGIGARRRTISRRKGNRPNKVGQQRETAVAILNGGGDDAVQQAKPCVSTRTCRFLPLISLKTGIEARGCRCEPPFFSAFHTLTVDDTALFAPRAQQ